MTRKMPLNTPPDVAEVVRRYYNGTTEYTRYRIHEWTASTVWASAPGGGHWAGRGMQSYAPCCHVVLSRALDQVGSRRGRIKEWRGRAPKGEIRAVLFADRSSRPARRGWETK